MVFVVGVGWQYGPGASGGSLGMGFLGGSALGLRPWPGWGIGDSWMLFLWRRHAALLGMPVPADVGCQPGGRTVSGVGPGGGLGIWGRSASGLGLRLGLGGLGPGWCAAGSMGWCMRLGPALVWGSSMHRCLRRGAGPIEAGKRALPGCLIVLCSLGTDWMMGWGSFSSAVGSGGPHRAAMGPGLDGLGPPPWADLG